MYNFIRAIFAIVIIIGLALLLGQTRKTEHPAIHLYSWLGAIAVLLIIRWCL